MFRVVALIVAGALLNIGFYFMLFILTPILSGIVVGFVLARRKDGAVAGFFSSFVSFLPLHLYIAPALLEVNPVPDIGAFYLALVLYVLLLSTISLVCGILGSTIARRFRSS